MTHQRHETTTPKPDKVVPGRLSCLTRPSRQAVAGRCSLPHYQLNSTTSQQTTQLNTAKKPCPLPRGSSHSDADSCFSLPTLSSLWHHRPPGGGLHEFYDLFTFKPKKIQAIFYYPSHMNGRAVRGVLMSLVTFFLQACIYLWKG